MISRGCSHVSPRCGQMKKPIVSTLLTVIVSPEPRKHNSSIATNNHQYCGQPTTKLWQPQLAGYMYCPHTRELMLSHMGAMAHHLWCVMLQPGNNSQSGYNEKQQQRECRTLSAWCTVRRPTIVKHVYQIPWMFARLTLPRINEETNCIDLVDCYNFS